MLLAYDAAGGLVSLDDAAGRRFRSHRDALNAGEREFSAVVRSEGLRLATDRLLYFSNWITPVGAPRRYDTRFFLAVAPERQEASHDGGETIAHAWMRPAVVLDRCRSGECKLGVPTRRTLERFADFSSAAALAAALGAQRDIPAILVRVTRDGRYVIPGEPGYEEAGRAEG